MNPVDTLCAVFIGYHAIVGLARGFVYQLLRLSTWIVGVALSRFYSGQLAERMLEVHSDLDPGSARVLAWAVILAVVLLVSAVLLALAKKLLRKLDLSGLDRVVGLVFGAVKAALIVVVVAIGILSVARAFEVDERLLEYRAVRWSMLALERSRFALPSQLASDVEERIRELRSNAANSAIPSLPPGAVPSPLIEGR